MSETQSDIEDLNVDVNPKNLSAKTLSDLANQPSKFIEIAKAKLDNFMMEDPDIKQKCDKITYLKSL